MDIAFDSTPDRWLIQLSRHTQTQYIIGFTFPLNNAVVHKILKDKAALSHVLNTQGIPCVPHALVVRPEFKKYTPAEGIWQSVINQVTQWQSTAYQPAAFSDPVVIKANEGSGGKNIFFCHNQRDIEWAIQQVFQSHRQLVISPWVDANQEYRLIVLNQEVLLCFGKLRGSDLQHNLSHSAHVVEITNSALKERLVALSQQACYTLGAKLAVVDILENQQGQLSILEINGAVCLEQFVHKAEQGPQRAKAVYRRILDSLF